MRKNLGPSDLGDLLELPLVAVLATYRADGDVLLSPVWHRWRDGGFDIVTSSGNVKARHLRRDPRAGMAVYEHVPPYRGLELRCRPHFVTDGILEAATAIAIRYLGAEEGRRYVEAESDDTLLRLEPGVLRCWDFADDWPAED